MFKGSTNNTYITPKVEWRSTQNISNNTSSVTATFYLKKSSSSSEATRGTGSWVININGNTKTISKYVTLNANNTYQEIGKHTATVNHNTDGTKDINIKVTGGIPSTSYTSTTCSKNVTLPRIPRNSLLNSVNAVTVNNGSITYNWTVYSGSFNHKLNVRFGSTLLLTFVASGDKAGTYSKTLNLTTAQKNTLFNAMSNSKKVTALFELQTFSGTTQIGSSSNTTADVKVSSASAPTFSGECTYRDSYPVTAELIEDDKKLVANASVLVVTTPATAAKDGASISKYLVSVGNKTVTSLTGGEIEFGELTSTGKTTITLTAIDTRGYEVVQKRVVEVTPYFPPRFNSWTLRRVNEVEEEVVLSLKGEFSPVIIDGVQRNNLFEMPFNGSLSCFIREGGELDKFYTIYPDFNGTTFTYNGDIDHTFDVNKSYEVELSVNDYLLKRAEISIAIPKGKPLVSLRSGKVGINTAFPQFALDVEGDIGLSGTLPSEKLWSGTLTKDQECTLSDDLWNYRFVKFKAGTYVTYPLSTVYSGTSPIRAIGSFAGEEHIEIQAIRGTYTKPSDVPTFKLDMMTSFSVSTSGITNNATYTTITEIWGLK